MSEFADTKVQLTHQQYADLQAQANTARALLKATKAAVAAGLWFDTKPEGESEKSFVALADLRIAIQQGRSCGRGGRMSYRMLITYRCDGCGLEHQQDRLSSPAGWLEPSGLSQAGGPHLCRECSLAAQHRIMANIVPVEVAEQAGGQR